MGFQEGLTMKNLALDFYKQQQRRQQGIQGFRTPKKPTKAQMRTQRGSQLRRQLLDLTKLPDEPPEGIPGNQEGQKMLLLCHIKKGLLSLDWDDARVVEIVSEWLTPETGESSIVISDEWEKEPHLEVLVQGKQGGNVMQAKLRATCPRIGDDRGLGLREDMPDFYGDDSPAGVVAA
jgi:hypothetical protein